MLREQSTHLLDEGLGNVGFDKRNCPLSLEHLHHHAVLCCGFIEVLYEPHCGIMTLGTEHNEAFRWRTAILPAPMLLFTHLSAYMHLQQPTPHKHIKDVLMANLTTLLRCLSWEAGSKGAEVKAPPIPNIIPQGFWDPCGIVLVAPGSRWSL